MFRRRDKESDRVVEVGLDELLWPGASTEDEPDAERPISTTLAR